MELPKLVQKRAQIKSRVTRLMSYFNANQFNQRELKLRLSKFEASWQEFDQVQSEIETLDDSQTQLDERDSFENSYFQLVSSIEAEIERIEGEATDNIVSSTVPSVAASEQQLMSQIKLPTINLPTFNGTHAEWLPFKDTFTSLIDENPTLNTIQKFYYLKSSLKGDAIHIIESLPTSNSNYAVAWELLRERFENKRILIQGHVRGIFELPASTKESAAAIRQLCDGLWKNLRALEMLEQPTDQWDTLLLYIISNKMDPVTRREWETRLPSGELPTLEEMTQFLKAKCQILETLDFNTKPDIKSGTKPRSTRTVSHVTTTTVPIKDIICDFCKGDHFNYNCENFLKLTESARLQEAKSKKLCINCLRNNHNTTKCRSKPCKKCGKCHHTLLHLNPVITSESKTSETAVSLPETTMSNHSSNQAYTNVLLSTAQIQICDYQGNVHYCRALLDSGSQSSFITKKLCNKLQLQIKNADVTISGIGQSLSQVNEKVNVKIQSIHNAFTANINCFVIKKINENLPMYRFDASALELPPKLILADPGFNKPAQVEVLLGADIFYELLCAGQVRLKKNMPILQKSVLGWIVSGPIKISASLKGEPIHCNHIQVRDVQTQLAKFWEIEEATKPAIQCTKAEAIVERHFKDTTTRHHDHKFIVKLPFKQSPTLLGDSKQAALKRFYSLERRLAKDPALKTLYCNFMKEYETLGHMEESQSSNINDGFYLPHHCVVKDSSTTTKLRVVFDGSAKTTTGLSLNDILYAGPTVQDDLFSIIIRFRKHRIVLTADIEKMYRQIWISTDHQKYQQILWRPHASQPIKTYTLKTVTYGTKIAPFFATRCLQELALQEELNYPDASKVLSNDFYVDDCLTGTDTIDASIRLQHELTTLLHDNGLTLRKWRSNRPEILEHIVIPEPTMAILTIDEESAQKTLGLVWHSIKDILQYSVGQIAHSQVRFTKRQILSTIAQIFDPLGLIGPIIIVAKIILQRLWQHNLGWDEALPLDLFTRWTHLYRQLEQINTFEIPRHVTCPNPSTIELHGFSDASEAAYGACVYIRSMDPQNECTCQLLCAKSRVAPLKNTTIPRLELCAALLLAQLAQRVKVKMNLHFTKCVYWCDSTITLAWIHSESTRWKTFVANRVSEIHDLTVPNEWRHVRTNDNPADLLTRGVNPSELRYSTAWWNGPAWLSTDESAWPLTPNSQLVELPEVEARTIVSLTTQTDMSIFTRFSNLNKLQRVTAYCLRFITNSQSTKSDARQFGPLTVDELTKATNSLIKLVQSDYFSLEIQTLTKQGQVHHSSKLINLHPFLDNDGIVRVGGRLQKSSFPYIKKHPIVLPSKHNFTKMLARHHHIKNLHVGPQGLLALLRDQYWPISGRNLCKQVVRDCVQCFKVNPRTDFPLMGELPSRRITPSRPFITTGIDYAGPLLLKDRKTRGCKTTKAYICVFVCFTTKAIHLELVSDLTTQAFLATLRRFVARRGKCLHIYSDNATNFKGANSELNDLAAFMRKQSTQTELQDAVSQDGTTWHFIPARSPHYGGLWEAGVKLTKHHLKRVLGNQSLTFEDTYTILTQIEACLNSRPLSPLSSDPSDLNPLTPAHFLIGEPLSNIPEPSLLDLPITRLDRHQQLQQIYQSFWKRWSTEYISELQLRQKWNRSSTSQPLQPGDLVLLKEPNLPPLKWKMGRITEVHPGSDNIIRVVKIQTSIGTTTRSVHKICRLPTTTEEEKAIESATFQGGRNVQAL